MTTETPACRGCGTALEGQPFYTGKPAYIRTNRFGLVPVPTCHYGGHVCSERCDRRASAQLEGSMPGCSDTGRLMGNLSSEISRKWDQARRDYPGVFS
jgi:hypothetical protein